MLSLTMEVAATSKHFTALKVQLIFILSLTIKVEDPSSNIELHYSFCERASIRIMQWIRVQAMIHCQLLITPILVVDMIFSINGHDHEPNIGCQ